MKKLSVIILGILISFSFTSCGKEKEKEQPKTLPAGTAEKGDAGYAYKITLENMTFNWKADRVLSIKLKAKTEGWVAVGFNSTEGMKDANFIMGYVKDGKVTLSSQFGVSKILHKNNEELGDKDHFSNPAGTEKNGETEISFTIPYKTGSKLDRPIDKNSDTIVMLAYGQTDMLPQQHLFRAKLKMNLATGAYTVMVMGRDKK